MQLDFDENPPGEVTAEDTAQDDHGIFVWIKPTTRGGLGIEWNVDDPQSQLAALHYLFDAVFSRLDEEERAEAVARRRSKAKTKETA